jgi:hypothetical protein
MKYYFDIMNLDADMQGALIATVQSEMITSDEAIARAFEWLDKPTFIKFMEWWKTYDFQPIVYANLDDDCDNLITAIQREDCATVITVWER